jgi:N-acetylmuramoyl-L-alanine amidase
MGKKVAVIAAMLALALTLIPRVYSAGEALPFAGKVIAIDPGHGGEELGSTACAEHLGDESMLEKRVNLAMASQLQARLTDGGATVVMTRTGDDTLDNHARAEIVNSSDAEVVVTMHLNGWDDPTMDGVYVFYGKARKDKAFAQVMHDAMWDVLGNTATTYSDYPDEFRDFGIRQFAAGILLWAEVPATLVESVFLSNHWECEQLADPGGARRQEIVQAIYDGLNAWFNQPQPPPKGKNK